MIPASRPEHSSRRGAATREGLTSTDVRARFDLDAATGVLRWKVVPSVRVKMGMVAGSRDARGYGQIKIAGKVYRLHRVIWLHHFGEWPQGEIDHRNGNVFDNRIENLRLATRNQNEQNKVGRNSSGLKGAAYQRRTGRWRASITLPGKRISLGTFGTAEEAHAAYAVAAKRYFGAFARV